RWALSNNSISGSGVASSTQGYGYWLWSVDNNQNAGGTPYVGAISGGTVSAVDVGLYLHNVDTDAATNYGIARTGAHASIANVTMNVKAGGMGIQVKDSTSWATANIAPLVAKRNVSLNVGSGVTINGGAKGLVLEEAFASVDTVSGLSFNGQTASYIELVANTSNIDATAASFEGKTGATASVAENLAIEDKMVHKQDNAAIGLIRVKNDELFVTANSGSIARGITNSDVGDTLYIGAGTYNGTVALNKVVNLVGVGAGTVINGGGANGINVTVSGTNASTPLAVRNLTITGASRGVNVNNNASYLTFDGITFTGNTSTGLSLDVASTSTGVTVANSQFINNGSVGIKVHSTGVANNLTITGNTFTNNVGGGFYSGDGDSTVPVNLTGMTMSNNTFTGNGQANNQAAIYIERMTDSAITDNTFVNNGIAANPRAIVINLKWRDYSNVTISRNVASETRGVATNGYGLWLAARNDGTTYAPVPASLSNAIISENEFSGFYTGVGIANNVKWPSTTITNNKISGGTVGLAMLGSGSSDTLAIRNNSITDAAAYLVYNDTENGLLDVTNNWFGAGLFDIYFYGNVVYDQTLDNGTDSNSNAGFQP
ncbi:MAG: right-handed parallel beta-helix repeat-containing protein, partial [Chloroflexota bacterium]